MFNQRLIAKRGENGRTADVSAKLNCLMRTAHAGDFNPSGRSHV